MTATLSRPNAPGGLLRSVAPVRRRPGLDWAEFSRHWREDHAAIASRLDGMTSYVQAHARPELQPSGLPEEWRYDGAAFAGFSDLDALARMRADAGYLERAVADEAEFVDRGAMAAVLLADGWVEPPADPGAVRRTVLVFTRLAGSGARDLGRTLLAALETAGVARPSGAAWSVALDRDPGLAPGGGAGRPFDGLVELWFDEPQAAAAVAHWLVAEHGGRPGPIASCLVVEENRVL